MKKLLNVLLLTAALCLTSAVSAVDTVPCSQIPEVGCTPDEYIPVTGVYNEHIHVQAQIEALFANSNASSWNSEQKQYVRDQLAEIKEDIEGSIENDGNVNLPVIVEIQDADPETVRIYGLYLYQGEYVPAGYIVMPDPRFDPTNKGPSTPGL